MAWSAENATKAFLQTLKTISKEHQQQNLFLQGNSTMEPDVAEFISAMAAGNGARLMVEVCAVSAGSTTLALVSAAHQTGGRVVCIVPGQDELQASVMQLGREAMERVEMVVGDAGEMLAGVYRRADFVVVDCDVEKHERVFEVAERRAMEVSGGGLVVGYNAFHKEACSSDGGLRVDLLPIGHGLRVARVPPGLARRSQWVVRVDECTGEEHVFRVRSPRRKWIEA